jgi:predicted transcriptional regulator of viral defense system
MIAERQHGVCVAGPARGARDDSERGPQAGACGALHRVHRGVYAVRYRMLPPKGLWMAAVLACGRGAVLSHRSAAALWGIYPGGSTRIEVSSPGRVGRRRPGITVHSGATLEAEDVALRDGVPCTTVARTLLDLAQVAGQDAAERACERAEAVRLFDLAAVQQVLVRAAGRRGARGLGAAIAAWRPEASLTARSSSGAS